jgi:hypothetical protein
VLITTGSILPDATVGIPYSLRFAATGGTAPYSWSLTSGDVPGLSLNSATGVLGNVPTAAGVYNLSVQARDAAGLSAAKSFTLTVGAGALLITPPTGSLSATVASPFTHLLAATGGTPPYSWSVNGLPDGLNIDAGTGRISGLPRIGGNLLFTARVTDAARSSVTELFQISIAYPPVPAITVKDLPLQSGAAEQHAFAIEMDAAYPVPLTGEALLTFLPDSGGGDPSIQFADGGRILPFTVPSGSVDAQFTSSAVAFQTGTVAGTINLSVRLQASGIDLTPTPVRVHSIRVERAAPVVTSARFTRTPSGIEVQISGYSTAREITQAVFRFSASSGNVLSTSDVTVAVESMFNSWFNDGAAAGFGSQFTFTQTFSVQGDANAVTPVSVTLSNRLGTATADVRP